MLYFTRQNRQKTEKLNEMRTLKLNLFGSDEKTKKALHRPLGVSLAGQIRNTATIIKRG
jgi:hypothetical protein